VHEHTNGSLPTRNDTLARAGAPGVPDLLDALVKGSIGPLSRLRETIDLTLDDVASWIAQPRNRKRIAQIVTLLDAQTQLMVCQHRLFALAKLTEVIDIASPEVARRACRDLLKLRLIDPAREEIGPDERTGTGCPPLLRELLRKERERLGGRRDS